MSSALLLKDDGYPNFKKIIHKRKWIGRVCRMPDGTYLGIIGRTEVRAASEREAFDETAKLSRVTVYVMTGRIAADDVEAVKAINSEVRDLMDAMQDGIRRLDVKAIRDAADRAKEIGSMLPADAQVRAQMAIDTARQVAKNIVKAGEAAATEVDEVALRKITEMRTAFLDLDADGKAIEAPVAEARGVDLDTTPVKGATFIERSQPREREIEV
jgi:hypothetical protein